MFCFDYGFECQNCGKTIGGGLYNFEESLELMREHGWISRSYKGEYLNFCCQDCLVQYRNKMENKND